MRLLIIVMFLISCGSEQPTCIKGTQKILECRLEEAQKVNGLFETWAEEMCEDMFIENACY